MGGHGIIFYHLIAFGAGFLLDLLIGDPEKWPHSVQLIGKLIDFLDVKFMGPKGTVPEKKSAGRGEKGREKENIRNLSPDNDVTISEFERVRKTRNKELRKGGYTVLIVIFVTILIVAGLLYLAYAIHPIAGIVVESLLTWQCLAIKSLRRESLAVYKKLKADDLPGARNQVARIVGRDTDVLDKEGVVKAAIETVAESTCDGILAPMLFLLIGGPVAGYFCKAANTMDSMIGYRSARYRYFGRTAAQLDDLINFLPARIGAYLIIFSALLSGKAYDGQAAFHILMRDGTKTESPNAGQVESATAGALGLRLGGPAVYNGEIITKPYLGDEKREAGAEDIRRANHLMMMSAVIFELIGLVALFLLS